MNAWFEFDKYFKKLNESPAYYASTALHPALKWGFFEDKWNGISNGVEESTWVIHARREVEDMWTRIYDLSTDEDSIELDDEPIGDDFEDFLKIQTPQLGEKSDFYISYCKADRINECKSPLQYWIQQESMHPQLSRFAFDMLSIPAMSTECERVFSSAKLLISDTRNRLGDDIIEVSECMKSWLNQGF